MGGVVQFILGSGSPRRRDILTSLGVSFEIVKPEIEEVSKKSDPIEFCEDIVLQKFMYLKKIIPGNGINRVLITGDTIVNIDDKVYGKPSCSEDAKNMLMELSGRAHQVVTSLCVGLLDDDQPIVRSSITKVQFLELSQESVEYYLTHNRFLDKAGSYAIQDPNCYFVSNVIGSFTNVIGLPIELLDEILQDLFKTKIGDNDWKNFI